MRGACVSVTADWGPSTGRPGCGRGVVRRVAGNQLLGFRTVKYPAEVNQAVFIRGGTHHRMVNHEQIIGLGQPEQVSVPEVVKAALFPKDLNVRIQLFEPLRGRDERREGTAVIPGNPFQLKSTHAASPNSEDTRIGRPSFAERQAASSASMAASPRLAGEPFLVGSRMESIRFVAGAMWG
jgi:hypothetical protein